MDINKIIKTFFNENKGYMTAYFIFMFAYPLSSVFLPSYYGDIADSIKQNKTPNFKLVIILLLFVTFMYFILNKLDTVFIPKLQSYIRINIIKRVLENFQNNFVEQEVGSLISKIVKLPLIIRELFGQIRSSLIPLFLVLIMVVFRFSLINVKIGMMVLAGMITAGFIFIPIFKKCLSNSIDMDSQNNNSHEKMSELFENMLDIYSMNTIDQELNTLKNDQQKISNSYTETFSKANKFRTLLNLFFITLFLTTMVYSYSLFKQKIISTSNIINIVISSMYIIQKIGSFSGKLPDILFNLGIYNHIRKYLLKLDSIEKEEYININNGDIKFKNIGLKYGNKTIFNNFNLHIKSRESVVIVGKIGSGKTSLIKSLLKLVEIDSGSILIDNKDIKNVSGGCIRSQILYVRQNPIPFNRTLFENIVYGNYNFTEKDIQKIFDKYKLHNFFGDLKLNQKVGKKGSKLSGGQKQMIFLLRILLSNKKIIVLDEPTTFLDENSIKYVLTLIKEIIKNKTVLIITHDPSLEKIANKTIKIENNNIL